MRKILWGAGALLVLAAAPAHGQTCVSGALLSTFTPCTFNGVRLSGGAFSVTSNTTWAPRDYRVTLSTLTGGIIVQLNAMANSTTPYGPVQLGGVYGVQAKDDYRLRNENGSGAPRSYELTATLDVAAAAGKQIDSVWATPYDYSNYNKQVTSGFVNQAYVQCAGPDNTVCASAEASNSLSFVRNTASGYDPGNTLFNLTSSATVDASTGVADPCTLYAGNYTYWAQCAAAGKAKCGFTSYYGYDRCDFESSPAPAPYSFYRYTAPSGTTDGSFYYNARLDANSTHYCDPNNVCSNLAAAAETNNTLFFRIYTGDYVEPSPPTTTVPEPATVALLGSGMALIGVVGLRRRS